MKSPSQSAFVLRTGCWVAAVILALLCGGSGCGVQVAQSASPPPAANDGETIVLVRHGEIPKGGLGQLTYMGLHRALALPGVLIGRFGRANAIFAPNPADQIEEGSSGQLYSYVRPLATIEPTAIALGLPVSTQLAYQDITDLQSAVTAPAYANSTIFIAWEHSNAYKFAQQMLRFYGQNPSAVPPWPSNDFETIYVFHIAPPMAGSTRAGELTFQVQQEDLTNSLSSACPDGRTNAQ